MPAVGPISAGHLRTYIAECVPPLPCVDQIEAMIGKLSIAMPKAAMSDAEANERTEIYCQALKDYALPDLQQVFKVLLRTCRFFPTIAEIETAIAPIRGRRTRRIVAARMLLLKHDREWKPPAEMITPHEAKELGSILADPLARNDDQH